MTRKPAADDGRQARDKVAAARVWLMKHKPFFGVLARALRIEVTRAVPAFRLHPDDRLQVHPEVVAAIRMRALYARLAHLSLHAALGAFVRRRGRNPARWNLAHDMAIAPLLDAAGLSTGTVAEQESLPSGAAAEAHYEQLAHGSVPHPAWCDLCDGLKPKQEQASPPTERRAEAPAQAAVALPGGPGGDGGREGDEGQDDGRGVGEGGGGGREAGQGEGGRDGHPTAEDKARALQWQMRLLSALEEEVRSGGRTFGDMPAWLEEMVRATVEPPAHWSAVLQRTLCSLQRTGRSYLRPSRRMSALAGADGEWPDTVTMPGRRIEQGGRLAVVVDTSASISKPLLARFLGTVASIATAENIDDVRLLCADATVTSDETVFAAELQFREVALVGRGGSDFRPALHRLSREALAQARPFSVVYLCDLDGRFPAEEATKGLSLLWVVPPGCRGTPPFGECVRLLARRD